MGVATGVACKWGLAYFRGWAPLELSTHDSSTSTSCRGWYVKRTFTCQLRLAATSRSLATALSCAQQESNDTLANEQRAGQRFERVAAAGAFTRAQTQGEGKRAMARAHGTAGRHATRNDAHPLARVVQVFQQRFAQRPIGWKAGAGAAELVPHLIQRLGIIARLLDALECGEVLLAVRTRKGPAHIASLAHALARYAVRTVVSIVTKRSAYGFHGVPDDMGDICVGVAVLPERSAELRAPFGHRLMMATRHPEEMRVAEYGTRVGTRDARKRKDYRSQNRCQNLCPKLPKKDTCIDLATGTPHAVHEVCPGGACGQGGH